MSVDLFLPKIVQQAIVSQRLESNQAPGQHVSHNDPSGEGGRSGKIMSSPVTHSIITSTGAPQAQAQFSDYMQAPLQPPYGQYEGRDAEKSQTSLKPPIAPLTPLDVPENISSFLNDIAKQYGVAPPSAAQLGLAFQQAETYQPKPITVIDSNKKSTAQASQNTGQNTAQNIAPAPARINEADIQRALELQKAEAGGLRNLHKDKNASSPAYDFDALPENIRKRSYDYGRMLNALEHYSQKVAQ